MATNNKPLMLKINPTAERVGLSPYIIRKWAKNGTIKAVKAGNKIFVNNDALDEYLNSHSLTDSVEETTSDYVGLKPVPVKL